MDDFSQEVIAMEKADQDGFGDVSGGKVLNDRLGLRCVVPFVLSWRAKEALPHELSEGEPNKSFEAFAKMQEEGYTVGGMVAFQPAGEKGIERLSALVFMQPPGYESRTRLVVKENAFPGGEEIKKLLGESLREILPARYGGAVEESKKEEIEEFDQESFELVELMAKHLSSEDEAIRSAAYQGLMSLGKVALGALPAVEKILREGIDTSDKDSRQRLAQALTLAGYLLRMKQDSSSLPSVGPKMKLSAYSS